MTTRKYLFKGLNLFSGSSGSNLITIFILESSLQSYTCDLPSILETTLTDMVTCVFQLYTINQICQTEEYLKNKKSPRAEGLMA